MEARGIVRHDVGLARDVEGGVVVAVEPLVLAGPVAEIGGGAVSGDGPFAHSGHSRGVVGAVGDRGVADVMGISHEIDLGQEASVLEVAVGDRAGWVCGGD